jgi:hypothetical protein
MKRKREAGQAIASVALGLVVLTGIVGLAIDMGYLRYAKRRMQSAADSAAIAGASELAYASGNYVTAARNDSKVNGFEDGANGVTVTPSNPPADAPFSGVTGSGRYVEVKVQQAAPTFFMRIFGVNSVNVSATAVAELGSSRGCVYSLSILSIVGIDLGGDLRAQGCGVVDNSLLNLGPGCIHAASLGVVLNLPGNCDTQAINISPAADPLAYLQAPTFGGGCVPLPNINQPATAPPVIVPPPTPGTAYCSIVVQPTNAAVVQFQPGLYAVANAPGLQLQGSGSVIGNGVTFYVANPAQVQITTTGNVTLTAPADVLPGSPGIPGGVLFFQDRANAQSAQIVNGVLNLTGALYFPNASLTLASNNPTAYLILVANSLQLLGTTAIGDPTSGNNYSSLAAGSPIKAAVLVQ